jgi:hypothetical protein
VQLIGVPGGYCPVADRHKKTMKFERLEFVKKEQLNRRYKFPDRTTHDEKASERIPKPFAFQ